MKKILRYLSGTQTLGITLSAVTDFTLTSYYDVDWGGDTVNRKSQTGMLIYLGETLVSWSSRKQVTVARSSTEAEYRTIANTVEELQATRSLLTELGVTINTPMRLLSDNQGATFIANNPICHTKLMHVAMDLHFVRKKTEVGEIEVKHIPGKLQRTDILTKALKPEMYKELRVNLVGESPTG